MSTRCTSCHRTNRPPAGSTPQDAAFLAANGFTAVRLGVIWAAVEPQPGVINTDYLKSINDTVKTLSDYGIYTIIDMHQDNWSTEFQGEGAPAWATMDGGKPNPKFGFPANYWLNPAENNAWKSFWDNVAAPDGLGLQDHYAQTWENVASYFSGNPAVIGYDVMNEPFPGPAWPAALIGIPFFGTQQLAPMYNQVDAAIRAVDPNTPLYIEPPAPAAAQVGNILGVPVILGAVNDPEYRSRVPQLLCRSAGSALHVHLPSASPANPTAMPPATTCRRTWTSSARPARSLSSTPKCSPPTSD